MSAAGDSAKPAGTPREGEGRFRRSLGLFPAITVNTTQMVGIGPFITIPLMVAAMGGPQAIIGWFVGALLAFVDGLVWAELGAAMPGAGGSYLYLREAFQYRSGRLMPFLFVWVVLLTMPLIMSTGIIGIVQYLGYFAPHLSTADKDLISVGLSILVVGALYRKIESIRALTLGLWVFMVLAVGLTIAASYSNFHANLAFTYPGGFSTGLVSGLGSGLIIAIYDYFGYYTVAEMGDELKNPGRVMPRAIVVSVVAVMIVYLAMNIGVVGTIPWQQVAKAKSIASLTANRNWGHTMADVITILVLITAFASVFTGLLGASRLPYNAARDRVFFRVFGRMHPRHDFPNVALLAMGLIMLIGSFFNLTTVINLLEATSVIVWSVAQVFALTILRRRQPGLRRPYKQWLYPIPSLGALAGWIYIFVSATTTSQIGACIWVGAGVIAYPVWAYLRHDWPFAKPEIREVYLDEQRAADDQEHPGAEQRRAA